MQNRNDGYSILLYYFFFFGNSEGLRVLIIQKVSFVLTRKTVKNIA